MKEYCFDAVFPPTATQADVFADAKALVASAVDGHNVCVFAYGQTGSGKTHTVYGGDLDLLGGLSSNSTSTSSSSSSKEKNSSSSPSSASLLADPCDPSSAAGLAPRAAVELFRLLEAGKKTGALAEAEVTVSMLELYCDELSDLLSPSPSPSPSSSSSSPDDGKTVDVVDTWVLERFLGGGPSARWRLAGRLSADVAGAETLRRRRQRGGFLAWLASRKAAEEK